MKTTETSLMHYDTGAITKATIQEEVNNLLEKINEGEVDPIKAIAFLAGIEKVIQQVRSQAMELACEEFEKYGEKAITVLDGCNVSMVEAGVRYNYSNCDKWNEIKSRENIIAEERKELEQMLKTLKKPMTSVDDITGEIIELIPPVKTSTTTLKITIK